MFEKAVSIAHDPGRTTPEHSAEGGAATGVFGAIQQCGCDKTSGYCILNGAGIGDAAALVLGCDEVRGARAEWDW